MADCTREACRCALACGPCAAVCTSGVGFAEWSVSFVVRAAGPSVCVCVCYGPTGRGTRTGHVSVGGTRTPDTAGPRAV
eukprot:6120614-Prymnesium_polylepis.1